MALDTGRQIGCTAPLETGAKLRPTIGNAPGDRLLQSAGMKPITRILVPVDLSARSLQAAAYAASLAGEFGSDLVFLHVLRNEWPLRPAEQEVRARIAAEAGGGRRFLIRDGQPAAVILRTAESENADLILIPTRGRPAKSRLFGGSVAARVLREARCAVWAGLDDLWPLSGRPIRNILCGLSLGSRASTVLRWSAALAKRLGASLSIVHASTALEPNPALPCDREWRFRFEEMVRDEIRTLQFAAGTDAAVWLLPGKPLKAIPPLAGHLRADLLVLGKSPRRRFLEDLRTLSFAIACRAPCPVASV